MQTQIFSISISKAMLFFDFGEDLIESVTSVVPYTLSSPEVHPDPSLKDVVWKNTLMNGELLDPHL